MQEPALPVWIYVLKIKHIVQENDKDAFIIITNAREVLGKGFR